MSDSLQLDCDAEVLSLLYYVLLGREPEMVGPWDGTSVAAAATIIAGSDEFKLVADACALGHFPAPSLNLSHRRRASIAAQLAKFGAPMPRTAMWHDLLVSALAWLRPCLSEEIVAGAVEPIEARIRADGDAHVDAEDRLESIFQFDRQWFVAAYGDLELASLSQAGLEHYATQATLAGLTELSPFFTISGADNVELRDQLFRTLDKSSDAVAGSLLKHMRLAAKKGKLGHWLFDAPYYLAERDRAFATGRVQPWQPLDQPYLDFIANGDLAQLRPHPLFCPVAYRALNPDLGNDERLFAHFVQHGQYREYRTSALFDPDFYRVLNPRFSLDVVEGRFSSLLERFCRVGAANDLLFSPDFDAGFYLGAYPDVVDLRDREVMGPGWHFVTYGASEGRQGSPYFDPQYYLERYPAAKAARTRLAISPLEHFLLFGSAQKLRPGRPLIDREVDLLQAKTLYERRALESFIRLSRKPLDFSEFRGPTPILSVVVPVHNQANFTARFLEQAFWACAELKRRTGGTCEISVVSNGSTDETNAMLETIGGISTLITHDAIGYPRAVNEGARASSGKYLLIVNNDIEFEPSIFADLVTSFARSPDCGVLGVRILQLDMTVQEVGACIMRDGDTRGYRRGKRSHEAGRHKTNTGYVSGCFLCLERSDFDQLGGFDERYSPGYYDDVDLCLRISEATGKAVMVDPELSILHYENASFMKGRPIAANYPMILRNRQMLIRKHSRLFESAESSGSEGSLCPRQDRLLMIVPTISSMIEGDSIGRIPQILGAIHDMGISHDILALGPSETRDEYPFPDVAVFRGWMPSQSAADLLDPRAPLYTHVWVCRASDLQELQNIIQGYKSGTKATIICDIESLSVPAAEDETSGSEEPKTMGATLDRAAAEFAGAAVVDRYTTSSERVAVLIRSLGRGKASVIPYGVDRPLPGAPMQNGGGLLFLGPIRSPSCASYDAVTWFVDAVIPKIELPDKQTTLIGNWQDETLARFREANSIDAIAFVDLGAGADLRALYCESLIAVAPGCRSGEVPYEVIEAMLAGTPVVMSETIAEQIGYTGHDGSEGAIVPVRDDGHRFADAIRQLAANEARLDALRAGQIEFAQANFGRAQFEKALTNLLVDLGMNVLGQGSDHVHGVKAKRPASGNRGKASRFLASLLK